MGDQMLDHALRTWWVVVLTALLGAGAGALHGALTPPGYTASAYVIATPTETTTEAGIVDLAQAYGRVVDQPEVLGRAAEELGEPAATLRGAVQGVTSPESPLVELTASAGSAGLAAERANAVADALVAFGTEQDRATGVELSVFSTAEPPPLPSSASTGLSSVVGGAAGILVGVLAVLAGAGQRRRTPTPAGTAGPAVAPAGRAGRVDPELAAEDVRPEPLRTAPERSVLDPAVLPSAGGARVVASAGPERRP